MPIFVQWQWKEHTNTFLTIFHFWDDGAKTNLRMKKKVEGFETVTTSENEGKGEFISATSLPYYVLSPPLNMTYMTWAPSHPEFCFLTEVLTYANLINGLKESEKRNLRPILEGRLIQKGDYKREDYIFSDVQIHRELAKSMCDGTIVLFDEGGICCKVCPEYIDYLRNLLKPYLKD